MQEDKNLKSLLSKYAMQEPSEEFDNNIMQLIEKSKLTQPSFLINRLLLRVLAALFAIISIALVATSIFAKPKTYPINFSISFSPDLYKQLFSFIVAFWIVMFINLWCNKRNKMAME